MNIEYLRGKFWDEFFTFKEIKGSPSLFRDLTKDAFIRKHSIQVYAKDNLRLMIGVNKRYARSSLHITWENLEEVYSQLKNQEELIFTQFRNKRQPELTIKPNPASVVVFLKDFGYQFPPSTKDEKIALMEWLYQNAFIMNDISRDLGKRDTKETERVKKIKPSTPIVNLEASQTTIEKNRPKEYADLVTNIHSCTELCKKPKDQMLLGRIMAGESYNIELMIVGLGPNEAYAKKTENRVVFGDYSRPTGPRVRKLISLIEDKRGAISCWGTNAIKCDYRKENEKLTILRCRKHLIPEIDIINPKIVVLFGAQLSKIFLNKSLVHGGIVTLFEKYLCIQSIHPASRASGKRFDESNIDFLADRFIQNL